MSVLQTFNKLIILANDTITAYSLDVLSRIILGQADPKTLDSTSEKLAKSERNSSILFFRVGVVAGRTLGMYLRLRLCFRFSLTPTGVVVYATKGFLNTTVHTLEAVMDQPSNILQRISSRNTGSTPTFRKYGEASFGLLVSSAFTE